MTRALPHINPAACPAHRVYAFLAAALLLLCCNTAFTAPGRPAPQIFYTDVLSGPASGGENNNGAYLSIFGKHFGTSLPAVRVFINDREVADYLYLGPSLGRPDVQQLSVQVGAVTSGPIRVEVAGKASNTNHRFTLQPGRIIYVALDGDDSSGAVNKVSRPFRTLQNQAGEGIWAQARPGDFIVLRGGQWTDEGKQGRFLRTEKVSGTRPTGKPGTGPVTLMGYPGENVHIQAHKYGGIHKSHKSEWIVISGLRIEGSGSSMLDGPVNLQWSAHHWRVINNELYGWDALAHDAAGYREARSGGIAGNGSHVTLTGNRIHDIGGGTKNHGIYIDFDGKADSVDDIEIAWNHIYNTTGGNAIQTYSIKGDITGVRIHHNLLHDGNRYGINLSNGTHADIDVADNIVFNFARAGLRINTMGPLSARVHNNIFYNVDYDARLGAITNTWDLSSASFEFRRNIVIPAAESRRYLGGTSAWPGSLFEANLWFGTGPAPREDRSPVNIHTNEAALAAILNGDFRPYIATTGVDSGLDLSSQFRFGARKNLQQDGRAATLR